MFSAIGLVGQHACCAVLRHALSIQRIAAGPSRLCAAGERRRALPHSKVQSWWRRLRHKEEKPVSDPKGNPLVDVPPGAGLLGREWIGLDEARGAASIKFTATQAFTNRHGTIQGGFLAAMLDSATGIRALAELPPNMTAVTMTLTTRFLRPARVGVLIAEARVVSQTDREIAVEADLTDPGDVVVAKAMATLRILPKKWAADPRLLRGHFASLAPTGQRLLEVVADDQRTWLRVQPSGKKRHQQILSQSQ
jgi:uncharacterized protein (TIGR00369 family)